MSGETLSFTSAGLFLAAHVASSSPPVSFNLLSSHSALPPVPSDFPRSKIIPGTRFVVDGFRLCGDFSASYFLSHFHSDHYTGLSAAWSRGIVYCSDITARLLEQVLGISPSFIVRLPLNEVVLVDGCEVTLIDANHCPGAVQFLFSIPGDDGKSARYVHTGDFRFCDSMKLEPRLSEFVGCDGVYLDTTYCDPKFLFPSLKESIDYVVGVIERVGNENRNVNKSVLFVVATYVIGKERILVEISRRCGRKIHVDSKKMAILRAIGYEDDSVFTEDPSATDVRVVGWNVLGETWPYFRPNFVSMNDTMLESGYSKVVGFVPTGWTYEVRKNKFAVRTKDMFEIHLVPYSEHSNFSELREYVRFLRPKRVIPTVGSDIENVDSKHAAKMQKHFAGLVDELANKKEFLMGFKRAALEQGETVVDDDDDAIGGARTVAQHEVNVRLPDVQHCNENEFEPQTGVSSSAPASDGLNNLLLLTDKEKEDLMQELQHCLPTWVTQDLMHELLKIAGTNVVEAVSYFYEYETEFHERADSSIDSLLTTQSDCKDDSASVPNLDLPYLASNLTNTVNVTHIPNTKFPKLKPSVGSDISPGKRRKNRTDKSKKKTKLNPNPEPGGKKQASITNFFTKAAPSQVANPDSVKDKSANVKVIIPCDATISYKQELEQLVQIIGDSKSFRSYAATIIEKARGDVSLALDMYYNGDEIQLDDDRVKLDEERKLKQAAVGNQDPSPASDIKVAAVIGKSSHGATEVSVSKNVNAITIPPERYSPREHACWNYGHPAPYIHLARAFEIVEGEKGKIKATSMLCNMFRSLLALSPEDVLPAVYLCTNKIAPDHENMELNIGGSMVTGALEEVCGTNKSKIRELYNSFGDLGDVAQECRQNQSLLLPPSPLLIRDVFATLRKISMQTGNGSSARKKSIIVGLMRSCREKEIKFLVRTLVRNLRIGAMMRTILPALAQAVAMNSQTSTGRKVENLKEKLQSLSMAAVESFNLLPNLDVLVPSLISKGIEFSTDTLTMVPGIPIRPMLAKITNGVPQVVKLFKNKAFTCEHKYDGQRAQIHKLLDGSVRIFSRNGDETTSKFPDVVHIIQDACKVSTISFILDAEVVAIDRKKGCKLLSFQELSSRERGGKDSSVSTVNIKVDVCVYVFDVMFIDGKQLLSCPLRQRRTYFKDLFNDEKPGYLEYAKETTVEVDDAGEDNEATLSKISAFFEDALHSSCEGIMAKTLDIDAGYFPSKRADSWLKVKRDYVDGLNDSLDLVPIGAWHGNGRKAGWYSPFLMACYNPDTEEFESVCRVMSGFSDSFYTEMKESFSGEKILTKKPAYYRTSETPDMWFSTELVWQIRGADFTISPVHQAAVGLVHPSRGISVRFPRFVHSVTDRKPEDCSTSSDIAEMFHSQKRKMEIGITVKGKNR